MLYSPTLSLIYGYQSPTTWFHYHWQAVGITERTSYSSIKLSLLYWQRFMKQNKCMF